MSWIEVSLRVKTESAEVAGQALIGRGSLGVWEPESGTIVAYFPAGTSQDQLQAILEGVRPYLASPEAVMAKVLDQDWVARWKASLTPLRVTPRLVIVPSWRTYQAEPGEQVVVLDPGMAFGTGHHETTRMCLELLDERLQRGDARAVLDLGTGSGILAIAAAHLGAGRVVASDIDPEARAVALDNVRRNGLISRIQVVDAEVGWESGPFDVVVANLTAEDLRDLAPRISRVFAANGEAILSGILRSREPIVIEALSVAGLGVQDRRECGEWVALRLKRNDLGGVDFPGLA
jgi:ribosomal protein L11 methyltransferase